VAFEVDPENASRLREHAERNAFSWLNVEDDRGVVEIWRRFFCAL
jgi:hypothetical protein